LGSRIELVVADCAYDTKASHALLKKKGTKATITALKKAELWEEGYPRNEAEGELMAGELKRRKKITAITNVRKPRLPCIASSRSSSR